MRIVCKCFGIFKEVAVRNSPFGRDDNIIGVLANQSSINIEHIIYNNNWFKIEGEESYIIMWIRAPDGIIDYALDRGHLKLFTHKTVTEKVSYWDIGLNHQIIDDIEPPSYTESVVDNVLDNMIIPQVFEITEKIKRINVSADHRKMPITVYKKSPVVNKVNVEDKYKKEKIPATVRNIVWVTYFNTSKKGQCWLCKVEDISSANFECGHVVSERNGGKPTIDNLRPICSFCNKSVGTMNMNDFKEKYNIP